MDLYERKKGHIITTSLNQSGNECLFTHKPPTISGHVCFTFVQVRSSKRTIQGTFTHMYMTMATACERFSRNISNNMLRDTEFYINMYLTYRLYEGNKAAAKPLHMS